jgi:multidrug efflux system membrane fusion protein
VANTLSKTIPHTLSAVGNVRAHASVIVMPQVDGQIVEVQVKAGQYVEKGQVLFQIDPRPYQAAVKEVKARLVRTQILLRKAEEDQKRFSRLATQNVISREQYDQAVTDADSQRSAAAQDEAALAFALLQLEYATIKAPISGRAGSVLIDAGNVVKAGSDNALLVINDVSSAIVVFAVPERNLPQVMERFQSSSVSVSALADGDTRAPVWGKLTSIDNTVDKATGTIRLEATFSNQDQRLWPGQFARVTLELAPMEDAVLVPAAAVLEGVNGQYCYVVRPDNTVEVRQVETIRATETILVAIKGLSANEVVVVDGQLNLTNGALVSIKDEIMLPDLASTVPQNMAVPPGAKAD